MVRSNQSHPPLPSPLAASRPQPPPAAAKHRPSLCFLPPPSLPLPLIRGRLLGGVMSRRKVSKSAQIIFNNQQRLVVALEGSGGVAQMGGDDDR